ncbi:MAG: HTTM domain-containing protein, partial [Candidatus Kapabacteria bacterium]|nr:HTTM domain-containing protein [Candidatus Kapabacteria bacterium]
MDILNRLKKSVAAYSNSTQSIAPLAVFRIIFGACVCFSTIRFMWLGWIHEQYIEPHIHFHYFGFAWVKGVEYVGEIGVYAMFGLLLLAAVGVMIGAWYRVSSVLMFLTFTYIELLDITYYLNHYYFVSIIAGMLIFLPANRSCSVDVRRNPALRFEQIPSWMIDVLKVQIALVYCFAGIAKINADWLFHALPLSIWLPAHDQLPLVGEYFRQPWLAYLFSWSGMLFDCSIPFFLLWHRTRVAAFCTAVAFHAITGWMFQIGVFPLVMSLAILIFFSENFHLRIVDWIERMHRFRSRSTTAVYSSPRFIAYLFTLHIVFQLLFPWRYLLYPGNMFWTEQGYRFGWRVMLMEKAATATFTMRDGATGREGIVDNGEFLNTHQEKQMAMQPDMILEYAHFLAEHYKAQGVADPMVRAEVYVTLNARPSKLLIDPNIDLSKIEDGWSHKT